MKHTQQTWEDEYKVHSYEADLNGNATLVTLCKFMQESAWNHAEHLKLGYSHLQKKGLIWILSKQKIHVQVYPRWGDWLKVVTWTAGKERLFWYRDFFFLDSNENVIAAATTTWFIVDIKRRRPVTTVENFNLVLPDNPEHALPERAAKVPLLDQPGKADAIKVGFKDIDVNQHMNNLRYIESLTNSLPLDILKNKRLQDFEINYLSECSYGDELDVNLQDSEDGVFLHSLVKKSGEVELCRAKSVWVR